MARPLIAAYRFLLVSAAWVVPAERRDAWREDWLNRFWTWLLSSSATGDREALKALKSHTWDGIAAALIAFRVVALAHPALPIAAGALLLATVAISTQGFAATRLISHGPQHPAADQVSCPG